MICHNCGGENRHIAWCDQYRPEVIYTHTTPRARNTDPVTSHHAAASVATDTLTRTQALILEAVDEPVDSDDVNHFERPANPVVAQLHRIVDRDKRLVEIGHQGCRIAKRV